MFHKHDKERPNLLAWLGYLSHSLNFAHVEHGCFRYFSVKGYLH